MAHLLELAKLTAFVAKTSVTKANVTLFEELPDSLVRLCTDFDSRAGLERRNIDLKYNKFYIGLAKDGQPNNFALFRARKNSFNSNIRLASSPDIDQQLETAGIEVMDYDKKWSRYRLRLSKNDIKKNSDLLLRLLKLSYGVDPEVAPVGAKAKAGI